MTFGSRTRWGWLAAVLAALAPLCGSAFAADQPAPLKALFFGDQGHHRPSDRFQQIQPALAARGIDLVYKEKLSELTPETLKGFPVVLLFANHDQITPEAEKALLDYVEEGGGLAAIHCASFCFRNSPKFVAMVGAQFKKHGAGVFRETVPPGEHPVVKGYGGFASWDESYVHHLHNEKDRTVLTYRVDENGREPWTWVRTQGKGRVFYTAWGHDQRTWSQPGFQNLLERGLRWAAGQDPGLAGDYLAEAPFPVPELTAPRKDVEPFQYQEAKVAFYPPQGGAPKGGGSWNKMQLPLEAPESQKHYRTPVGFEAKLFAAEPMIGKPLAMAWDERGRLWLAETVDYPNELKKEGEGRDRIRIVEDTDGDGAADKTTIFADKLSIPTSLCFTRGGLLVFAAPNTIFLKDTDGDDKADVRETLFTGWDVGDTHAGPSNMQYGLDNWIYGTVGYAGFRGKIAGEPRDFRTGVYRFKPDGSAFEFLRNTNNNTWGLGISEEGIVFASTANHNPSCYLPIPNRYYEKVRGWSAERLGAIADTHLFKAVTDKIRQVDHHGGYTAAAGHSLYTARTYPQAYWNRTAFVAEPTGHLVGTFVLEKNGADFRSTNPFNLLAGDDEWQAPTMAEVGPDGQVWVIDWYNYIVQHNPTPAGFTTGKGNAYETDLRDKRHGRIYRIVAKDGTPSPGFDLSKADAAGLVAALSSPNLLWRRHAQRLLVERKELGAVPALVAKLQDQGVDAIGLNVGAMHALWTLHGLGALSDAHPEALAAAVAALKHPSAGVRRNALAALPRTAATLQAVLQGKLLEDSDAQVKLAALLALSDAPTDPAAGAAAADFLRNPAVAGDRWLAEAATSAAAAHDVSFLAAALPQRGQEQPSSAFLEAVRIVAEHWSRGAPQEGLSALVEALEKAPPAVADAALTGLDKGWPKNTAATLAGEAQKSLARTLPKLSVESQSRLARLDDRWKTGLLKEQGAQIAKSLMDLAAKEDSKEDDRLAAARQVVAFRPEDAGVVDALLGLLSARSSPTLSTGVIEAVVQSRSPGVGPKLLARWGALTPGARAAAARGMLSRADLTNDFLNGLEQRKVPLEDLTLDQRQALAAHPQADVAKRAKELLAKGGGLPDANRQKVLETMLPAAQQTGDVAKGKLHFTQFCGKCHKFQGEGGAVGPDLTGMSVHPKAELLMHILDPSRSVEGNYRTYTVAMTDGRVLTGLLTSETRTTVEVLDVEGKRHAVNRDEIDELSASTKSLMPEGFEKQLNQEGFRDLLEYVTQRPKYLPLNLAPVASVVTTKGMFYDEASDAERLVFSDWGPKTFAGVPFQLVDPQGQRTANALMLFSPNGNIPPKMPKQASLPVLTAAKAIHFLSGVSGWGAKEAKEPREPVMIVRLHYAGGKTEDHRLYDGRQFADYIGPFEVPDSKLAFKLRGQQLRYFAVEPGRNDKIERMELLKGADRSAPVVMAVTVETK